MLLSSTTGAGPIAEWPDWPEYGLTDDLLPSLETWAHLGRRFVIATLVDVEGSSPRPVGSEMAICESGEVVGYVSGGCVEAAVAAEAAAVLADGRPRLLDYGAGSPIVDVKLACGGRIRILVREIQRSREYVDRLLSVRRERRSLRVITDWSISDDFGSLEIDSGRFEKTYEPSTRVVVVGADPISLAVVRMTAALGFEAILVRPNGPTNPPLSVRLIRYDRRGIESALSDLELDQWCAVYTLTHDAETDHSVLVHALRSNAFCVGALGSRRKTEARRQRLLAAGLSSEEVAKLHAPAGLPLGGKTPQEIALSILGQVVSSRSLMDASQCFASADLRTLRLSASGAPILTGDSSPVRSIEGRANADRNAMAY